MPPCCDGVSELPILTLTAACKFISDNNVLPTKRLNKWVKWSLMTVDENMDTVKHQAHGLSRDQKAAIHLYTCETPFYRILNNLMRERNRSHLKPFFAYIRLLVSALDKLPRYKGLCYRGVTRDLHQMYKPKKKSGKKAFFWSFKSTTNELAVLQNSSFFGKYKARTMFNIHVKTGADISLYSQAEESEVLLRPGTAFQVKSLLNASKDMWIIELVEVNGVDLFN